MKTAQTAHLLTLSLLACAAAAQDAPPGPAKQLDKYKVLAGTWEGSGSVVQMPGAPETKWTAKSTYKWVLGGHFLREDTHVDMGAELPAPLVMRTYHGWDRENERYFHYSISNSGRVDAMETYWSEDGTMVSGSSTTIMGRLNVERWVTEIEGDKITIVGHNAMGPSDFYVHVSGEMKRTSAKASRVAAVDASFMPEMSGGVGKMDRFARSSGTYAMKGWFIPGPGLPKMNFTGRETAEMIFDGLVMESRTFGDPIEGMPGTYEGVGYLAWDDHAKAYSSAWLNNMGEISHHHCRWADTKTLVFTTSALRMGQPRVSRAVMIHDAYGRRTGFHEDAIIGTRAPARVFEATLQKKN